MSNLHIYSVKKFAIVDGKHYTYGGFGEYVRSIATYFDTVTLCIHAKKYNTVPPGHYLLDRPNLRYRYLPWYSNELQCLFKLPLMFVMALWYARDADIINARIPDYTGVCGAIAARIFRIPVFYNIVANWAEEADYPTTRLKGFLRWGLIKHLRLYVFVERMLCSSSLLFVQGSSINRYKKNPKANLVVSTSISSGDVVVKEQRSLEKNTAIDLLSVGRFAGEKGHLYLLEACRVLQADFPFICLTLIGEGPMLEIYKRWITDNAMEGKVKLRGLMPHGRDLFDEYRKADIFILPSISEGTPKVVLEAMASSIPVIATRVGGIPYLIQDKINGLLVERQSAEQICDAIRELAGNLMLRDKISANARRTALEHTSDLEMSRIIRTIRSEMPYVEIHG